MIYFTVYGEPKGKGRPRFSRNGHTYTPETTANYENLVKLEFERQCSKRYEKGEQLRMVIQAHFGIPKSTPKKQREAMLARAIRPTKQPDADNILKIVADSLNGLAYHDDAQLVYAEVEKYISEEPRVSVKIEQLQEVQK